MRYVLLALFLVGCGTETAETVDGPLTDTAWSIAPTASTCGAGVAFASSAFTWMYDCSGSGFVARGDYQIDADKITMTIREATCRADQITTVMTDAFVVDGDRIRLSGDHGAMQLARTANISPAALVGCFEPGGSFVERPLAPL